MLQGSHRPIWDAGWEALPPRDLAEREQKLLRSQLGYVLAKSAFYQDKFKRAGFEPARVRAEDWPELPFTEKRELIQDQAQSPPLGTNLCVERQSLARIHRTSGTSGRPLFLALTAADVRATTECGARCFWASGLRPGDVVVHCLNYCLWIGGYTDHQSLEHAGAGVVPFGSGNSSALVEAILYLKPTAIHCTPSYLSRLEGLVRDTFRRDPADLGLKLALLGGEGGLENPEFRRNLEATWGFRAMNANYGVSDALSMFGAECEAREGLHFMGQGNLLVELLDSDTNALVPIRTGNQGEFVVTNLDKESQPLLRFRTHDVVKILGDGGCSCGRSSFRFQVLGRSDDLIKVKGVNVFPGSVEAVLSEMLDLTTGRFQIIVDTPPPIETLQLKVEVRSAVPDGLRSEAEQRIRERMKQKLYVTPAVHLVPEGSLGSDDAKARKLLRTYAP